MNKLFTKEYRINEMDYKSIGKVGRFEWLVKKTNDTYHICGINQYNEVEFGTEKQIDDQTLEIINVYKELSK